MTLQQLRDHGDTITLYCAKWLGDRFCSHGWQPGYEQMIQYFGLDFEISSNRKGFLAMFECPKCGAAPHSLVWGINAPFMMQGMKSHDHQPPAPEELAAMRRESERVRAATAAQVAYAQEVRRRLAAERKVKKAIESGRDPIGPPDPRKYRKR